MDYYLAWLIPFAPLAAAIVCIVMAISGKGKQHAHIPVWIGLSLAAFASLILLCRVNVNEAVTVMGGFSWLDIGRIRVAISLQLDAISLAQICVVTCVSALVAFYARGYMHGDAGYARFFAIFSAFVFSMAMLVLANNLLVLYMFWEGVGLCSYLLIGYWYQRPAAAAAATKAFLVNRVADCGFLLGILLLWNVIGAVSQPADNILSRLDYDVIISSLDAIAKQHPTLLTFIASMLLLGAIGKSAQFPLHVWLPDAMEGPTPVSALIHAATMVTAGVFLLCRMSPLLVMTPDVLMAAGWIGGITALLAAMIALFQDDLKRVLAYSTVSQLGYMFMAISCGVGTNMMSVAVTAALFHVATHAFFKALLFLCAGNVMHAMGDVIDMREFGGLKRVLPKTHLLFAIGAVTLAGFPLLSGFWSKDGILSLLQHLTHDEARGGAFTVLFVIGLLTALLTAIYSIRAYLRTFQGAERFPQAAGDHVHEMPMGMLWPLMVLAFGSVFLGLTMAPTGLLAGYFHHIAYLTPLDETAHGWLVPILSGLLCLVGFGVAWGSLRGGSKLSALGPFASRLASAGANRFYFDEVYLALIVKPLLWIGGLLAALDIQVIDGFWRSVTQLPNVVGGVLRKFQSGLISNYSSWMTIGLIALLVIVLFGYFPL